MSSEHDEAINPGTEKSNISSDHNETVDVLGKASSADGSDLKPPDSSGTIIDILTDTSDKGTGKRINSKPDTNDCNTLVGEVTDFGDTATNNLTSIHSEVTSPVGAPGKFFEDTFINVTGDERWRGAGTPPEARVRPLYSFSSNDALKSSHLEESTPLVSYRDDQKLDYSSLSSAPEALKIRLKRKRKMFSTSCKIWSLLYISLVANVILFSAKVYVFVQSHSLAVLASAVDSLLDLVSQLIVYLALRGSQDADEATWPVGRSRLEPIGIIVCASLMGMASLQVIYQSVWTLGYGILNPGQESSPELNEVTVILLLSAIAVKALLFLSCMAYRNRSHSIMVLAEDHRNDVLSNGVALGTAYLSMRFNKCWWLDACGAIIISLYICVTWVVVAKEQVTGSRY